ncbi:hypothetical protein L2E82_50191 [Cichorium intybus]|nr:hypothetical protein L2E82_50191 [Cichorium intybus]
MLLSPVLWRNQVAEPLLSGGVRCPEAAGRSSELMFHRQRSRESYGSTGQQLHAAVPGAVEKSGGGAAAERRRAMSGGDRKVIGINVSPPEVEGVVWIHRRGLKTKGRRVVRRLSLAAASLLGTFVGPGNL